MSAADWIEIGDVRVSPLRSCSVTDGQYVVDSWMDDASRTPQLEFAPYAEIEVCIDDRVMQACAPGGAIAINDQVDVRARLHGTVVSVKGCVVTSCIHAVDALGFSHTYILKSRNRVMVEQPE